MAEKPGDLARDQLELSTTVAKSWSVERGDLMYNLTLSLNGGAFPKCISLIADKRRSSLTIHAIRIDEGYATTNSPISLH